MSLSFGSLFYKVFELIIIQILTVATKSSFCNITSHEDLEQKRFETFQVSMNTHPYQRQPWEAHEWSSSSHVK